MEEERQNPFTSAIERAAMVPVNAVKLPFTLLREAVDPRAQQRLEAPEAAQRALYEQATGQPAPFSEGREWANRLSLGLIPGNQPATVDPSQLNPEQSQKFGSMTPLMQALLQSKRPQDFADLMNQDDLFAEPDPTAGLVKARGDERVFDPSTRETLLDVHEPAKVVPPGAAVTRGNEQVYRNEYEAPSLVSQREAAAEASYAAGRKSDAQASLVPSQIAENEANAAAKAKDAEPTGPSLGDRKKLFEMEGKINGEVSKRTKDLERAFTAGRNALQLFELRDSSSTPVEYIRELQAMGFKDLGNRSPRAVQDLMLLQAAVRITDPPGRISDTEQKLYSGAREMFDPGIVEAALNGETFTGPQRNEVMFAINRQLRSALESNDAAVVDGRKMALRDQIAGQGLGTNPSNVTDPGLDIRKRLYGKELGNQADYPLADDEAEQLLSELWYVENPEKDPTASEFVRFSNGKGFRLNELGP